MDEHISQLIQANVRRRKQLVKNGHFFLKSRASTHALNRRRSVLLFDSCPRPKTHCLHVPLFRFKSLNYFGSVLFFVRGKKYYIRVLKITANFQSLLIPPKFTI